MVLGTAEVSGGVVAPAGVMQVEPALVGSPETYFGSARNEYLSSGVAGKPGAQVLTVPTAPRQNKLYLSGVWSFNPEFAETKDPKARVVYLYDAKDVYFVASSASGATLKILIDGQPVGTFAGADVGTDGTVRVRENRLYKLVHGTGYGQHTLEIEVMSGTLDAYTFTFG